MSTTSISRSEVIGQALAVILPTSTETDLLRACLLSKKIAQEAWMRWQDQVGSLSNALSAETAGVKSLLPLLHASRVVDDSESRTLVRTAYMREGMRSRTYRRILKSILSELSNKEVPYLVLKGAAVAHTVYPDPGLRHCHDIDLLIREQDISRAEHIVKALRWNSIGAQTGPAYRSRIFQHESGLPLAMHVRIFPIAYYRVPLEEMWARSTSIAIAGVESRILASCDTLMHICGHASCAGNRESLRWVCDAWHVLHIRNGIDWDTFLDCVRKSRITMPVHVVLRYLADEMDSAAPNWVLAELRKQSLMVKVDGQIAALIGAQATPRGSLRNILQKLPDRISRLQLLLLLTFPPPHYFRLKHGEYAFWKLPYLYMQRPVNYFRRRIKTFFNLYLSADTD